MLKFDLLATDPGHGNYAGSHARRGQLTLNHGVVQTPIFMPVGTYGTVKGVMPSSLEDMGAQIILGNTFHLWMRPGQEVMQSFGGLHGFERWDKPILTDSGGFQAVSYTHLDVYKRQGLALSKKRRSAICTTTGGSLSLPAWPTTSAVRSLDLSLIHI